MTLGPLVGADERFDHQIVDTFATVVQTDRSWTEKAYATASARDGSLQLAFGIGKYPNRNVLDAFAGVSRGVEQWTVRASRELRKDRSSLAAGPIRYEVNAELATVTFRLERSDVQPIAFEWTCHAEVPAYLEAREIHRSGDGARLDADVVRFHQIGSASGWVELDGERTEFDRDSWVSTRDRSWGVRYQVGEPLTDVKPVPARDGVSSMVMWAPVMCERPDGSRYGLFWYYQRHAVGTFQRVELQGGIEHPDGRREAFVALEPALAFRDDNRRLIGGELHFTMADGGSRPITVSPVSDTGFHLGTGLYFGYEGQWHGQWRGKEHLGGEHVADASDPQTARRIHQMRSVVIRVDDPVGGGVGWGEIQSIVTGAHDGLGLTSERSFI